MTYEPYQAELAVSPATLSLDWFSEDPAPTGTFDITNTGNIPLNWTLSDDADWMSCDPVSGTVDAGASQTVTVTAGPWPGDGTYNGTITVSAPDAIPTEATVAVDLTCTSPPPPLALTLYPPADPVVVAPGETIVYDLLIESTLGDMIIVDFWAQALLPNGNTVTVQRVNNFPIQPNASLLVEGLSQNIPMIAPAGEYVYYIRAGNYPGLVIAEDSFGITVQGVAVSGGADDWSASGFGQIISDRLSDSDRSTVAGGTMPTDFAIAAAYPNPFNPSTTVSLTLPETADVNVTVYNVVGSQVAELANGRLSAGRHSLTFDASGLASGLYFIHAHVPGQLDQTQKVMLVR